MRFSKPVLGYLAGCQVERAPHVKGQPYYEMPRALSIDHVDINIRLDFSLVRELATEIAHDLGCFHIGPHGFVLDLRSNYLLKQAVHELVQAATDLVSVRIVNRYGHRRQQLKGDWSVVVELD